MTQLSEYDTLDPDLLQQLADVNLDDVASPVAYPPHTPTSRFPPPYRSPPASLSAVQFRPLHRTLPHDRPSTITSLSPQRNATVYRVESPTLCGVTTEWSTAGAATQGAPGGHVQRATPKKQKKKPTPAAYVVFCGAQCGVYRTWTETRPLVIGVSNNIFRGYPSLQAARAAFAYAEARSWTRVSDALVVTGIPALPQPILASESGNPLHESETLDDFWYIVYRGICPGVYRSHLESQLNTLGVRGAVHESVVGRAAAFSKYTSAVARGDTRVITPAYLDEGDSLDPFL